MSSKRPNGGGGDQELHYLRASRGERLLLLPAVLSLMLLVRVDIFHEPRPGLIRALGTGLGYPHTSGIVVIQLTQQGAARPGNKPCTPP